MALLMIQIKIQQFLEKVLSPTVLPDAQLEGSCQHREVTGVSFSCREEKKQKDIPTEVSCQVTITVPNTPTSSLSNELCKLSVAEPSLSFLPWQFSVPDCLVSRTYRFTPAGSPRPGHSPALHLSHTAVGRHPLAPPTAPGSGHRSPIWPPSPVLKGFTRPWRVASSTSVANGRWRWGRRIHLQASLKLAFKDTEFMNNRHPRLPLCSFFFYLLSTRVKIPELCLDVPKRSCCSSPLRADKASFHQAAPLRAAAGQEQQRLFSSLRCFPLRFLVFLAQEELMKT